MPKFSAMYFFGGPEKATSEAGGNRAEARAWFESLLASTGVIWKGRSDPGGWVNFEGYNCMKHRNCWVSSGNPESFAGHLMYQEHGGLRMFP